MAGSTRHLSLFSLPTERTACCPTCHPTNNHCSTPNPAQGQGAYRRPDRPRPHFASACHEHCTPQAPPAALTPHGSQLRIAARPARLRRAPRSMGGPCPGLSTQWRLRPPSNAARAGLDSRRTGSGWGGWARGAPAMAGSHHSARGVQSRPAPLGSSHPRRHSPSGSAVLRRNPRLPLDTDGGAHPHGSAGRRSSHHCAKTPQTSAVPGGRANPWRRPTPPPPCVRNRRPLGQRLPAIAAIAVAPSSAAHCRGRMRRGPQWLAAPMVGATQCRPPASGGQHRAGPPVDPSATARWGHRPATSRHPRFGASRWPQPPAPAATFHPNRADGKRPGRKEKELDDGWPESVEEQSLLLLVWRHAFYTQALLHTDAFTHRRFYTQTLFTRRRFYTQKLLHTDAFTHRPFYTQHFYTQTLLHTDAFYTQALLHTETFTHRGF